MLAQVNKSEIAEGDEKHFLFLLDNYRRDFLALVSQNDRISRLSGEMLAAEQPAERMPFFAGGRDEVNLMAGSVNAMADHKAGFMDWWKATMREADACERLHGLMLDSADSAQLAEAQTELRDSRWAKEELLREQHRSIHQLVGRIIDKAETVLEDARPGSQEVGLNTIRYSARSVQTKLEMVSAQ
jgi:methyl-accepting chemotaxis protein